jgi:DedD protein
MMDRALQERVIGATVLVLFVVLVVPVFLDGPPETTELVSERILLPGQDEQATQTVVLDRDREDPVPVVVTRPATASPEEQQSPTGETVEERAEPAVVEKEATSAAPVPKPAESSTGMWAVQLGSFSNKDNAERLAAELRKQGYAAFLSQVAADGDQLHRVRIGPQRDRDSAEAMAKRLEKVGHEGQVVPHP